MACFDVGGFSLVVFLLFSSTFAIASHVRVRSRFLFRPLPFWRDRRNSRHTPALLSLSLLWRSRVFECVCVFPHVETSPLALGAASHECALKQAR
jgi:hypothetical protein